MALTKLLRAIFLFSTGLFLISITFSCSGFKPADVNKGLKRRSVSAACFKFDTNDKTIITGYYEYEENDDTQPACPRDVVIPDKIRVIKNDAFSAKRLKSVDFPKSLEEIGSFAFYENYLMSVNIPNHTKFIGEYAFSTNNIVFIHISESLTEIKEASFQTNELAFVNIPDNIIIIEAHAFRDNKLNLVSIGNGITEVKNDAFRGNNISMKVCIQAPETNVLTEAKAFGDSVPIYNSNESCLDN